VYFLSSVTAFAELVHKSRYHCELNHGRRKGSQGPLDFENFTAQGCFLRFEWEKTNFTTFGPPRKILEKPLVVPPWKKSLRRPRTPHNWVWNGLELSITTFAILSLVCAGWTELISEIFCSDGFLDFGYLKCFFFS